MRLRGFFFAVELTDRSSGTSRKPSTDFLTISLLSCCFARHFFADFLDRTVIYFLRSHNDEHTRYAIP